MQHTNPSATARFGRLRGKLSTTVGCGYSGWCGHECRIAVETSLTGVVRRPAPQVELFPNAVTEIT